MKNIETTEINIDINNIEEVYEFYNKNKITNICEPNKIYTDEEVEEIFSNKNIITLNTPSDLETEILFDDDYENKLYRFKNNIPKKPITDTKSNKSLLGITRTLRERKSEERPFYTTSSGLMFPKYKVSFVRGNGGVGKTYGLIRFSREIIKKEKAKVFCWFAEDDLGLSKKRFENMFDILDYNEEDIETFYEHIEVIDSSPKPFFDLKKGSNTLLDETEYLTRLKEYCIDKDIIILDPLIGFVGRRGENDNVKRRIFMDNINDWCKKEKKTVIFIHHIKKNNRKKDDEVNPYDLFRGRIRYIDRVRFDYLVTFSKETIGTGKNQTGKDIPHKRDFVIVKNNYSKERETKSIQLFETQEETKKKEIQKYNDDDSLY